MKFNDINDDCLENIFSFLDIRELVAVLRVCQRWKILIHQQFQRERSLLITCESKSEINPSNDLINYYLNDPQDDANSLKFSYLQNKSISFPSLNFIQIHPSNKPKRNYSLLVLSLSNKLNFSQLDRLIDKFPNLNSIAFNSSKNRQLISPFALNLIFNKCRSLTSIDLTDCRELNTDCLKAISKCHALEHLDLTNCRYYGNNGLRYILRHCTRLKALFIGYNRRLTGQFFQCSIARVKYLDLTDLTKLKSKGLKALANNLGKSLESLITFPLRTDDSLKYVCEKFTNLRSLKLSIVLPLNLRILIDQPHFAYLRALSLNDSIYLTDKSFIDLMANFKEIREFELVPNIPIQTYLPILDLAKYWPKLIKLRLINITLTPIQNRAILKSFVHFKCLQSICVSLTGLDECDVFMFLEKMFNQESMLKFFNLEYFQQKNKFIMLTIRSQLSAIESRGFFVRINQLELSRLPPYLYLTKIAIRKYD